MGRRRIPTGLSGICAIDKPTGMTSHDVVNVLRQITGERRVGHTGTLDPLATGLLLVCVGPATRLADYLMTGVKTYEARVCFGAATNTDDAEGEIVQHAELPANLEDAEYAAQVLLGMCGEIEQLPPAFSAIKKQGITAYKAARLGEILELDPRHVHLYDAAVLATGPDYWDIRLTVSKGFYVRAFARDLGMHLHSAAHLGLLRRTASGCTSVEQASELASLEEEGLPPFIDAVAALGLPAVEITAAEAGRVHNGMSLTVGAQKQVLNSEHTSLPNSALGVVPSQQSLISIVHAGRLLALYKKTGSASLAHPKIVIPGGVALSS